MRAASDVDELAREGKLKLGVRGWLFGTIWYEVTGGPDTQHLVLSSCASQPTANRWTPCGRLLAAIGGKPISAGVTSCSCATNATKQRASFMPGTRGQAFGFSVAANAPASPISIDRPPVGPLGASCREVARSARMGRGRYGADQNRKVCLTGHISVSWGCLLITKPCESGGRVTLKKTDQIEYRAHLWRQCRNGLALVVGRFVDEPRARKAAGSLNAPSFGAAIILRLPY